MYYQDLADAIMKAGLVQTGASRPAASLNATIAVEIRQLAGIFRGDGETESAREEVGGARSA